MLSRGSERLDDALCAATKKGHLEIAEVLLQYGASPNYFFQASFWPDLDSPRLTCKTSVLIIAVHKGHLELSSLLLKWGANVNNPIPDPNNLIKEHVDSIYSHMRITYPQSTSSVDGRLKIIKLLLSHSVDVRKTELDSTYIEITPFNIAFNYFIDDMGMWLLEAGDNSRDIVAQHALVLYAAGAYRLAREIENSWFPNRFSQAIGQIEELNLNCSHLMNSLVDTK